MKHFGSLTIELTVGLFALLLLLKIMGRSSIAEATPFDFVSVVVLGDFVGNAIYDPDAKVTSILYAIALWAVLILLINFVTMKVNNSRGAFESKPAIIIGNGVLDRQEMKKNKLDMNRLQALLRDKDVFSFREVEYAILEANGKISVIKKPIYNNVFKKDLNLPVATITLPVTLVSDGVIMKKGLAAIGKSQDWLRNELSARGINDFRNVFIAEWRQEDGLFIQEGI
ncbi:uncharacterized membrane protein YcaP (DUF421 family) [Scopulibacillus darangshiensis]|uniref:Uncharacterized membrane protein YcaP (DUF421 family) n=1 Tax=Scopulibacillus darangshiensis TaxID=442528 RepID=A0A4R2NE03_9BACL|nr:DUF421 domain-containing protein [Scopulibacillus darangshiensis]TCP19509.1 uncharacterized membrane protein YcaP (DUF421 family) [Scopulibacillus darangshiensis]